MRFAHLAAVRNTSALAVALLLGLALGVAPQGIAQAASSSALTSTDSPATESDVVIIRATTDASGRRVFFDPIGVWVQPGTTIRWVLERSYHSVTAYHPDNGNYELRIPSEAEPFDSGMMLQPGVSTFEVTLTVPGVYDYLCLPHEAAGMVGRIIVGTSGGPGSQPFNYDPSKGWRVVPSEAQKALPSVERIMSERIVHASTD